MTKHHMFGAPNLHQSKKKITQPLVKPIVAPIQIPDEKIRFFLFTFSCFTYCVSPVTCQVSLTSTATATDLPPANSPTMHCRVFCKDPKTIEIKKKNCVLAIRYFTRTLGKAPELLFSSLRFLFGSYYFCF